MAGPNIEGQRASEEDVGKVHEEILHPSTLAIMRYFEYSHLPEHLHPVSGKFHALAWNMVNRLPGSEEVTVGLRKLLEAKDCFVRAAL